MPATWLPLFPLAESPVPEILLWSAALIVCLVVLFLAINYLKRWTQDDDRPAEGFALADLRALHRAGQLSDEEFDKAKERIVAAAQKAAARPKAESAGKIPDFGVLTKPEPPPKDEEDADPA